MKARLVIVRWRDAASEASWSRYPSRHTLSMCTTAGYLIHKSKDRIVIGASLDDNGAAGDRIAIPRSTLTDMRKLKIGKRL